MRLVSWFALHFYKVVVFVSTIVDCFGIVEDIVIALFFVRVFGHITIVASAITIEIDFHPLGIVLTCTPL
jgi:hypothetical protein